MAEFTFWDEFAEKYTGGASTFRSICEEYGVSRAGALSQMKKRGLVKSPLSGDTWDELISRYVSGDSTKEELCVLYKVSRGSINYNLRKQGIIRGLPEDLKDAFSKEYALNPCSVSMSVLSKKYGVSAATGYVYMRQRGLVKDVVGHRSSLFWDKVTEEYINRKSTKTAFCKEYGVCYSSLHKHMVDRGLLKGKAHKQSLQKRPLCELCGVQKPATEFGSRHPLGATCVSCREDLARGSRMASAAKRRAAQLQRTPPWLTKEHWYRIAKMYETRPEGYHVDHIVPLQGEHVSGLHVPWNLQHLFSIDNLHKSNKHDS